MHFTYGARRPEAREEGKGPALILLHGYPLDGDMWRSVSAILAKDFRVLRPDLPGRRDTPPAPEPTMVAYATFLSRLVEAIAEPVGIAGFSMGGYVLFEYLRSKPASVRAVAFLDTRAEADDEAGRRNRDRAVWAVREDGVSIAARTMVPKLLSSEARSRAKLAAAVEEIILRQHPNVVENDLLAMRDRADAVALLSQITTPALVIVGEKDQITPPALAERMARGMPKSLLVKIPGAGHLTPMESPEATATALRDFFKEMLAA
jgi:pimeloyl-ACP methyl ester carboxylesterase